MPPLPANDASFKEAGDASIEQARDFLDRHADRTVSLRELAEQVNLSPSHLQRSFKRVTGLSPKEYQDARRVNQLKSRLRAGDTVSRATYEAGFGSSSRVYERADRELGMTPAAFRRGGRGVAIAYTTAATPLGRVLVATTERGVCAVELGATDDEVLAALRRDFPSAEIARGDEQHAEWVKAVVSAVRDSRQAIDARIPLECTAPRSSSGSGGHSARFRPAPDVRMRTWQRKSGRQAPLALSRVRARRIASR